MSETAHDEARQGGDARRTAKTVGYIYSYSEITAPEDLLVPDRVWGPGGAFR